MKVSNAYPGRLSLVRAYESDPGTQWLWSSDYLN